MSGWPVARGLRDHPDAVNMAAWVVDRHVAEGRGAATAVLWDGGRWTYAELKDEVDRFAVGLADLGVVKNDKILVRSRNLPQTVAAVLAALRIGAVPVWVNALLQEDELAYILENSEARTAYTLAEHAEPLRNLQTAGHLDRIIVLDGDGALIMRLGSLATIGALAPPKLLHLVIDNGTYASTGAQLSLSPVALLDLFSCSPTRRRGR